MRDRPDIDIDDLQEIQCADGVARWSVSEEGSPYRYVVDCEVIGNNFYILRCLPTTSGIWLYGSMVYSAGSFETERDAWQYLKNLKR